MKMTSVPRALTQLSRRFRRAREGVAAVEFALILPLMLTMWLGTVEIGQAIAANRKSTLVARTLADLAARATTITDADMANIFAATGAVVAPFSSATLGMRVTSVKRNASGQNKVAWSDASGPYYTALAKDSNVTLPAGILTATDQTVIMSETNFYYEPAVAWIIPKGTGLNLQDSAFMVPRQVSEVTRK